MVLLGIVVVAREVVRVVMVGVVNKVGVVVVMVVGKVMLPMLIKHSIGNHLIKHNVIQLNV